jgi:hypothetical protein
MSHPADPTNPFGFDSMSVQELRKNIVDLVRQNVELSYDKKEYVASITTLMKENTRKIEHALEAVKTAEAEGRDSSVTKLNIATGE